MKHTNTTLTPSPRPKASAHPPSLSTLTPALKGIQFWAKFGRTHRHRERLRERHGERGRTKLGVDKGERESMAMDREIHFPVVS